MKSDVVRVSDYLRDCQNHSRMSTNKPPLNPTFPVESREARPNIGILLRGPYPEIVRRIADELAVAGFADIRPAHTAVFQHIKADGSRLSDLAQRAQLTKQSMGYLVDYLQECQTPIGPDPIVRRASLIFLTERAGKKFVLRYGSSRPLRRSGRSRSARGAWSSFTFLNTRPRGRHFGTLASYARVIFNVTRLIDAEVRRWDTRSARACAARTSFPPWCHSRARRFRRKPPRPLPFGGLRDSLGCVKAIAGSMVRGRGASVLPGAVGCESLSGRRTSFRRPAQPAVFLSRHWCGTAQSHFSPR